MELQFTMLTSANYLKFGITYSPETWRSFFFIHLINLYLSFLPFLGYSPRLSWLSMEHQDLYKNRNNH